MFFDKLFGKSKAQNRNAQNKPQNASTRKSTADTKPEEERIPSSQDVIEIMLMNADIYVDQGDYEHAFKAYKQIAELQPNATAQYNLGSLYAQGKGTNQSFKTGAYWFHQAELNGDEKAGGMCLKCIMDYMHENIDTDTPKMLFDKMYNLAFDLEPKGDGKAFAVEKIYGLAGHHLNKKEYAYAAKLFRAAAEFGNYGDSQNYLAVLYNAGLGVEKNDLAALYWFDRAVDNHVEAARQDRDGILNAYHTNSTPEEFFNIMEELAVDCVNGSEEIPQDSGKAAYWRKQCEEILKKDQSTNESESGSEQQPKKKSFPEVIRAMMDILIEKSDGDVKRITYGIPGTKNKVILGCSPLGYGEDADSWCYIVSVHRDGYDELFNHFLKNGNRDEVITYMKTDAALEQTMSSIMDLSRRVDEDY